MTPAARVQAAIEILDRILLGDAAERALTAWARTSRYAGSKDRAAVRDLVFDATRRRRSYAALSGLAAAAPMTGRALMIGAHAADPDRVFTGVGHAPALLDGAERGALAAAPSVETLPELVRLECPDWLEAPLRRALGEEFAPFLLAMQERAPVYLRVNAARASVADALAALARDGVGAEAVPSLEGALVVAENASKIKQSRAYLEGLVELQDLSSQAAVAALPLAPGMKVLDYCAGGGGKSLAIAAHAGLQVTAHDINAARLSALPVRAARARAAIAMASAPQLHGRQFDLTLVDAPCSGSGTWRR
ncbi:MAG: RsmB/NOP family class I SAM-dependent RNA methyltransferase, partial [Paracoccaceae bacterium]